MVAFTSVIAKIGVAALSLALVPSAYAYPTNLTSPNYGAQNLRRAEPQDFYLRIMPLGASITEGDPSPPEDSSGNGYRKFIRDKLRFEGWKVNMVGDRRRGTMKDNDHEGKGGDRITAVTERAKVSVRRWLPNVVLINAGTNDATQDGSVESVAGSGQRMRTLIDTVFAEVPNAVVVLSTLLPNTRILKNGKRAQENVDIINAQFRQLYRTYVPLDRDGNEVPNPAFKVVLAEMADFILPGELHDATHPNVVGQKKMAAVWGWAISYANEKGWLAPPTESGKFTDGEGSNTCGKELASGNEDPRGKVQVLYAGNPLIKSDENYIHDVQGRQDRWVDYKASDRDHKGETRIFFAQLVNLGGAPKGGELDEAIYFSDDTSGREVHMSLNMGDGEMGPKVKITIPDSCKTRGIRWGDVNGDGLDDFICISPAGEMYVTINRGGNPPKWDNIGLYKGVTDGADQEHVLLGDMDGDGRLDFCTIRDNGDIYCYRNGGLGDRAAYWQDMGVGRPIFTGKNKGDIKGVRLVDINGDGRYDWTWMDKEGQVSTYINQRGVSKTLIPSWRDAGVTHLGVHENIGDHREYIQFGRLFGSGRFDYIHLDRGTCDFAGDGPCHIKFKPYQNLGKGGRFQKGDGIYWGDTTGSGFDDYLWISPEGQVSVFVNKNTHDKFDNYATSAWTKTLTFDTGIDRRSLHVGDWDGDGKADIIAVTDRKTGALKVWHSRWDGTNFNWDARVIPDSAKCDQGWGRLYWDNGAHFADITGSGRVDYICMEPNGRATAWLRNEKGEWYDARQIKSTEDLDRANFRFSDVNGDGAADLLWVDKFSGDATVWYNRGQVPEADRGNYRDSLFFWEKAGRLYLGSHRGSNMYYPNLGGQGRADQVGSNPITGHAWVWFNSCPAGGDDVDGPVPDPGLPEFTPPGGPTNPNPNPDPEDNWFCSGNGGSWTPDLWREHAVGGWLLQRCESYSGVDGHWPPDVRGVPRVIAMYDGGVLDNAWNWPGPGCVNLKDTCDLSESDLSEGKCATYPERAFSLFAMRNLARTLQRWYAVFSDSVDTASLFTASISTEFLWRKPEDVSADPASWLTIVAGMFAAIGAILPPAGNIPANGIAGILTLGAGAAGLTPSDPVEDVRFSDFAKLQSSLGRMKSTVQTAMAEYFDTMLASLPPDGDREKGTELARLLESGAFADQDFGTSEPVDAGSDMVTRIRAAIIAEAWNNDHVSIVKWSRTGKMAEYFDPCGRDSTVRGGTDHAIACQFDNNYIITPTWSHDLSSSQLIDVLKWPAIGQTEEHLKEYGLDHATIIAAAENTQKSTGSFQSRDIPKVDKFIKDAIADPLGNIDRSLTYFNVPYCDLDAIDFTRGSLGNICTTAQDDREEIKSCVLKLTAQNCQKMTVNGNAWPYKLP
ncbi:related to acetylxylan esterase [Cephalotrichum gorgonifer]|uniref:Related to acetylxylan esterase n=1 Tax=Cephalotrichum gorgonifer TaxID=2041049 RepID=A0AAE8SQE4_9PEZI|nr:related to acetylxylan esterase [Cephalotrichum gorgonifer]